jgi:hypothetical protein
MRESAGRGWQAPVEETDGGRLSRMAAVGRGALALHLKALRASSTREQVSAPLTEVPFPLADPEVQSRHPGLSGLPAETAGAVPLLAPLNRSRCVHGEDRFDLKRRASAAARAFRRSFTR